MLDMRRRQFIALLGGAAAAWPIGARAQQDDRVRRVGVIGPRPENAGFSGGVGAGYPAMLDELRKLGFSEGRNLAAEFRSVEQEPRSVYAAAVELVRSNPDVLVAIGPELGLQAVVAATSTIPIVIAAFNYDPIARGYVKSLAQPGGNITGVFLRLPELAEKQVELLTQTFPDRTRLALLWDDLSSDQFTAAERRAKSLHLQALPMRLERPPYDFDAAFQVGVTKLPGDAAYPIEPTFYCATATDR
jgi:putative tryptophan/tyrosine transport system substrate-binding protein